MKGGGGYRLVSSEESKLSYRVAAVNKKAIQQKLWENGKEKNVKNLYFRRVISKHTNREQERVSETKWKEKKRVVSRRLAEKSGRATEAAAQKSREKK